MSQGPGRGRDCKDKPSFWLGEAGTTVAKMPQGLVDITLPEPGERSGQCLSEIYDRTSFCKHMQNWVNAGSKLHESHQQIAEPIPKLARIWT